jgi:hypothetical protein
MEKGEDIKSSFYLKYIAQTFSNLAFLALL